jgi:uncharacterized SAM-binding protein YcdF (DUF218 family)
MKQYDAIVVLGGGVRPKAVLPPWVRSRFDLALELRGNAFIMPLSCGTAHRPPPLDENGFPIREALAGARYLLSAGVPPDRILVEANSYDTIGNAYFSRLVHADPGELRSLLIITSNWHMPRTKLVFDHVYSLPPTSVPYQLDYRAAHDPDMKPSARNERLRKEESAAAALRNQLAEIHSLKDFHTWLFTKHDAYNAEARAFNGPKLTAEMLESY